jgi:pimeloyl-ACP methyl ester carboxylesterase
VAQGGTLIWFLVLLGICAALAAPFAIEHYRPAMSDGRRGSAAGQFAELSQGVTHFHLSGPADGPLIVCVHGLTTPSFVWEPLARALVGLGFRVLVYDLYGRGYSDRPSGLQDKAFFNTQLNDLLAHLEMDQPFHLIGYSMGGAIASGFAAGHPTRVRRLVLLASAGARLRQTPLLGIIRNRPFAGLWIMLAVYPSQLRRGIRAERGTTSASADIFDGQEMQLEFRGFVPAVLSSLRGILNHPMEGEHLALRNANLPVLALWGADDDVIPPSALGQLAAWNRTIVHEVVEDAGHGLPYTHTDIVLEYIMAFLPAPDGDDWGHDP